MADQAEQAAEAKTLPQYFVVQAKFGQDPYADAAYQRRYGGSSPNKNNRYNYLTDRPLKKGDFAVVDTPHGGLSVVEITKDAEQVLGALPGHKWIIDTVDVEGHRQRQETAKRRGFLLASLQERAREIMLTKTLDEALASDPASQAMMEELKALQ